MKKFLSLLLALTLVLSLVVVPARADTNVCSANPASVSLTVGSTGNTQQVTISGTGLTSSATYTWNTSNSGIATVSGSNGSATITAVAAGNTSVTCQVSQTAVAEVKDVSGNVTTAAVPAINETVTIPVTVTDPAQDAANTAFGTAITLTYGGRNCAADGTGTYVGYKFADADSWAASVGDNSGFTVTNPSPTLESGYITVNGTQTSNNRPVTVRFKAKVEVPTVTVTAKPTTVEKDNGTATLTATATVVPGATITYEWKNSGTLLTGSTATLLLVKPSAQASITCKAIYTFAGDVTKSVSTSSATIVAIDPVTYIWSGVPATTLNMAKGDTDSTTLPAIKLVNSANTSTAATGVTYSYSSSNTSAVTVSDAGVITAVGNGPAVITITAKDSTATDALYRGKLYTTTVTVSSTALESELTSVANGSSQYYYMSTLNSAAREKIAARLGSTATNVTVTNLTMKTGSYAQTLLGGTLNTANISAVSGGYITYSAPKSTLGKASFVMTATASYTQGGVQKNANFDVTFVIPVIPIYNQTFEAQYPQAVASVGNSYNYTVTPPTGYDRIALITKGTTPTTAQLTTSPAYNSTSITLNSSDFNTTTGKCTLYVMAWNSNWTSSYNSGKYYYGPLEVYQKNYNINYNGVAGETVQFAQSDFTDFMNEVAEARGDASKTKSYPYVTFDYVTFSLPTTAQGTLYYGGTAMSTSNSSGAFNTRTKVTNLDSVTFVPNAKTTAKTITLNFTLYATRYSSSSTSLGTTVSYSGTVVVNLVREDIKYTVSQGDSVRFDESDFLSYLRSTKGYSSNNTIDYVTFDQSAVSAVNEGSLYTYYNGYNYGGSVKTTDKFYYNATASQNALSDVAFLASRYAKTGETVYIPFTIYARYGTTGTGTRQLTGTVAIKIGQTMNFIDVKTTDYFYNSVKWAVNKGVTTGTSSTTFSPYNPCKRAEIVTFLWRAAGSPEPTITRNPFRDVNAVTHSSYYKAILWASQKGIAAGTSTTTFSPDQVCTRAQIVTFLYRYAGKPSGYYSNPFKDVSATNEASYYNAILWAVGKGITTGTSATTFSPYASCNRAEAVTFLYRYTNGL